MNIRKNDLGITCTQFKTKVTTYCPIGKDYYTADVEITVDKQSFTPDYEILDELFKKELNGKQLTHEDLNRYIFDKFKELFKPSYLKVEVTSNTIMWIKTVIEGE